MSFFTTEDFLYKVLLESGADPRIHADDGVTPEQVIFRGHYRKNDVIIIHVGCIW